jgi:hypothetical protein
MPRQIIAILLMLSLSCQCFVKLGIVIWYECNKAYVAKNLCENRNRPEKKCCGKCYLNKQLKKAETGSSGNSTVPDKWNLGEVALYIAPPVYNITSVFFEDKSRAPLCNESVLSFDPLNDIFHPPLA